VATDRADGRCPASGVRARRNLLGAPRVPSGSSRGSVPRCAGWTGLSVPRRAAGPGITSLIADIADPPPGVLRDRHQAGRGGRVIGVGIAAQVPAAPCQCQSPGGVVQITSPGAQDDDLAAAGPDQADSVGDVQGLPLGVGVPGSLRRARSAAQPWTTTSLRPGRRCPGHRCRRRSVSSSGTRDAGWLPVLRSLAMRTCGVTNKT
jgi:hypothetical protein